VKEIKKEKTRRKNSEEKYSSFFIETDKDNEVKT
jgi:hypothetical protein